MKRVLDAIHHLAMAIMELAAATREYSDTIRYTEDGRRERHAQRKQSSGRGRYW